MTLPVLRLLYKGGFLTGLLMAALASAAWWDERPVRFASTESKTYDGQPVINEIRWERSDGFELWTMRQSHAGPDAKTWDTIAIRVDRQKRISSYFQLKEGGHVDRSQDHLPYKIACFTCHTNGPRVIRPDHDVMAVSTWDQWRLVLWNLRITTYGRIAEDPQQNVRYRSAVANAELPAPTCQSCHRDTGFWARGPLTRQNHATIRFMLERGHMPPPGYYLSPQERQVILRFIGDI